MHSHVPDVVDSCRTGKIVEDDRVSTMRKKGRPVTHTKNTQKIHYKNIDTNFAPILAFVAPANCRPEPYRMLIAIVKGTIHVECPPEAYHKIVLQSDELKQFARAFGGPKVVTVQKTMANETDMGFSDHVISLENKFQESLDLKRHLSKEEIRYWSLLEDEVVEAVNHFYNNGFCHKGAKKKETMIFKVDFEKAFDSVRWDFFEDVLKNFGFGSLWCDWIVSCLKSSKGSVLVNGSPTSEFQFYKGLKQGDPLSPFLFILFMETLHLSFQNVVNAGLFKGVVLNNSLQLSHLFYADDAIFVVENSLVTSAANNIGYMTLSLPFSYLGVNVGGHMSQIASWDVVINKVLSRLSKWKMKVINKLEAIRGHFFHGVDPSVRKMMLVKWNNVLASKEMGGLGVSSFYALNRALIFKWVWKFRTQGNFIWTKVIKALHGEDGNLNWPTTAKFPSNWLDIIRSFSNLYNKGVDLLGSIKKKIGNGENTMFWDELWKGGVLFKNLFPRLYALESVKNISVADKMAQPSLEYSFRRNIRGGAEQVQMPSLLSLLEGLILANMIDRWMWSISGDEEFYVSSVRNYIDDKILGTVSSKTQWCKFVPIKNSPLLKNDGSGFLIFVSRPS
nr:RNA-directed DNA polymerase, eukaryota, reverse transcriptase zinc-binding domain protein [Tanacetum cinerariifolium]